MFNNIAHIILINIIVINATIINEDRHSLLYQVLLNRQTHDQKMIESPFTSTISSILGIEASSLSPKKEEEEDDDEDNEEEEEEEEEEQFLNFLTDFQIDDEDFSPIFRHVDCKDKIVEKFALSLFSYCFKTFLSPLKCSVNASEIKILNETAHECFASRESIGRNGEIILDDKCRMEKVDRFCCRDRKTQCGFDFSDDCSWFDDISASIQSLRQVCTPQVRKKSLDRISYLIVAEKAEIYDFWPDEIKKMKRQKEAATGSLQEKVSNYFLRNPKDFLSIVKHYDQLKIHLNKSEGRHHHHRHHHRTN